MNESKKTENCMICGSELEYLSEAVSVACNYCGKEESGYIECHARDAVGIVTQFALSSDSVNPMEMVKTLMRHPVMPMHGPEHHAMIAGVLVAAYKNLTGKAGEREILEAIKRGKSVPGGFCGLYGTDAAAIACGIAASIILGSTPLKDVERRVANNLTARVITAIMSNRGARCCKRSTYTAIEAATQYFGEVLGIEFERVPASKLKCEHSHRNKQCSKTDCRFYAGE
jgi:predicted RNA-binding Zn-ribbon protein involved in translation (DUF1610 family)